MAAKVELAMPKRVGAASVAASYQGPACWYAPSPAESHMNEKKCIHMFPTT